MTNPFAHAAGLVGVRIAAAMTLGLAGLLLAVALARPDMMPDPMPLMRRVLLGVGLG